ncbi:MAG: ferritin-like domain-containing protein, partial [Planctomycetota bacterium]
ALSPPLQHITKTVCLLESRCDDYADYLRAIFRTREPHWNQAIDQWNSEECQHGVMLRRLSEATDKAFPFDLSMAEYESHVSYHEANGESVRGSVAAEMVSRCVVEALASALYRVLSDAIEERSAASVFAALAQDEARHFGMFLKMLEMESESNEVGFLARLRFAMSRMFELEDSQIIVASCVIAGRSTKRIRLRREANEYLASLYALYRWKHLRYAAKMLLRTVGARPRKLTLTAATSVLWIGVRFRGLVASSSRLLFPAAR